MPVLVGSSDEEERIALVRGWKNPRFGLDQRSKTKAIIYCREYGMEHYFNMVPADLNRYRCEGHDSYFTLLSV